MEGPPPVPYGFTITTKDVYERVSHLEATLSNQYTALNDKINRVDGAMQVIATTDTLDQKWRADVELRVRRLERFRYSLPASLVVSVTSLLIALISALLKASGHG